MNFYLNKPYGIIIVLRNCVYLLEIFHRWAIWPAGLVVSFFHFYSYITLIWTRKNGQGSNHGNPLPDSPILSFYIDEQNPEPVIS